MLRWEDMTEADKLAAKAVSLESLEGFIRIFFQLIQGQKFKKNWHHTYECQLAERIYRQELNRAIINVAPGSTKTEIWSIHWPAWCIAKCIEENRPSRWLPLSYSDELVTENSARVKEILDSEEFQYFWPLQLAPDTKSKSNWKYTDENGNPHRMFGTSINGQVTGRRAGYMVPGFTGALINDDPLPPKLADRAGVVDKENKNLNRVIRSRLAWDETPIVTIQQRVCKGDTTDFLLSDKSPDDYQVFRLPAIIDKEFVDSLPIGMRAACISDTGFTGERCSYWPDKEPTEALIRMEEADPYMFSSQYQQNPDAALAEGMVYRKEVNALIKEGRLCNIPIEKHLPVYTFWDLGINDDMVIWLMQPCGKELRMIACYSNRDYGIEHYINWLKDFKDEHGIRYEEHIGPHDLAVRELFGANGRSRTEIAKTMGIKFKLVERVKNKRDSVDAMKSIFPRVWIDKVRCDTDISGATGETAKKTGWKGIKALRRAWDHDNEVFRDEVGPKWATNFTDAIQQMGLYYKDKLPKDDNNGKGMSGSNSGGGWMGS